MYIGWYDPDKKRTDVQKLNEAVARYERRWNRTARVALVNIACQVEHDAIEVRRVGHVAPNCFFVGEDEQEMTP